MISRILFLIVFCLSVIIIPSCKAKPEKAPTPPPPVEEPIEIDTMQVDTVAEVEIIEPEIPEPENRYFLIAASFKKEINAEKYRDDLIAKGYDSEVIVRKTGNNQDFYKVSFKGFNDKTLAFSELRTAMREGTFQDVWLLIK